MGLKVVLFDMGSTLIEFENHPWDELVSSGISAVYEELQRCGVKVPCRARFHEVFTSRYNDFWSRSCETWKEVSLFDVFNAVFSELGLSRPVVHYPRLVRAHYRPISAQTYLYEDVPAALALLRERGLRLGIVSNTPWPRQVHLADLQAYGLAEHFEACIFSADFGLKKPHPRIFLAALEIMGVRPAEVIHVGDRYREDIWGPQQVGIRSVLREHPLRPPEPSILPDGRIRSLGELPPLLEAWTAGEAMASRPAS